MKTRTLHVNTDYGRFNRISIVATPWDIIHDRNETNPSARISMVKRKKPSLIEKRYDMLLEAIREVAGDAR